MSIDHLLIGHRCPADAPGNGLYDACLTRYRSCRPLSATPRLIAITGYGLPRHCQRALEAGFEVHLTKPVNLQKVAEILCARADLGIPANSTSDVDMRDT